MPATVCPRPTSSNQIRTTSEEGSPEALSSLWKRWRGARWYGQKGIGLELLAAGSQRTATERDTAHAGLGQGERLMNAESERSG